MASLRSARADGEAAPGRRRVMQRPAGGALVDRVARTLETLVSRRSFMNRAAMVGTAVVAGKGMELLLTPGTAYARVCGCGARSCSCGSKCCTGYTAFCCTVNGGSNYCPPNTVMGGWWKADTSSFCGGGPRYYMDCNATCNCGSGSFCSPECDTTDCGCANGSCDEWRTGCVTFRYGQCNQHVAPIGRIVCRMVACVPPWEIDPTCTTASARDNNTAEHSAPCWQDVTEDDVFEYRVVAIPPPEELPEGGWRQVTAIDADGALLGTYADDVTVTLRANTNGVPVPATVQVASYVGLIVLSFVGLNGEPAPEGLTGVILSHPRR